MKIQLNIFLKAILLIAAMFCFGFSFNHSYGNTFSKNNEAKISILSVRLNSEILDTTIPGVPAAGCLTKNNCRKSQALHDKCFIPSDYYSFAEKSFFNFYRKHFAMQVQNSLRLHLTFCVLLI